MSFKESRSIQRRVKFVQIRERVAMLRSYRRGVSFQVRLLCAEETLHEDRGVPYVVDRVDRDMESDGFPVQLKLVSVGRDQDSM